MIASDHEVMAQLLQETGRYRVLRRFEPQDAYNGEVLPTSQLFRGLFVDAETTGLDEDSCSMIELGMAEFTFDRRGTIYTVERIVSALEDPGFPIPPEITELTGITTADVEGRKFDDERVKEIASGADIVVAYNASFDRPVFERRFPMFRDKAWSCALREVPWGKFGAPVRGFQKLTDLLSQTLRLFAEGHRAADDCLIGVHLLAMPRYEGRESDPCACASDALDPDLGCLRHGAARSPFHFLLESTRTPTIRVVAVDAPYEMKDLLKRRRYSWCDGRGGRRKGWYIDVKESSLEAEKAFLAREVYGRERPPFHVQKVLRRDLYSNRA